jgi:hypothetical protein
MISNISKREVIVFINLGNWLTNSLPFFWDEGKKGLRLLKDVKGQEGTYRFWFIWAQANILARLVVLSWLLQTIWFGKNVEPQEIVQIVFLFSAFFFSTSVHFLIFLKSSELVFFVNSLFDLNQKLGKYICYGLFVCAACIYRYICEPACMPSHFP